MTAAEEDNNKSDDNNKDDNDDKGFSALGLDRDEKKKGSEAKEKAE